MGDSAWVYENHRHKWAETLQRASFWEQAVHFEHHLVKKALSLFGFLKEFNVITSMINRKTKGQEQPFDKNIITKTTVTMILVFI